MRELRTAHLDDLAIIAGWIDSAELCLLWAGAKVGFPIQLDRLSEEIGFRDSDSWCLMERGRLAAFGQIISMGGNQQHLARLIVDPNCRGEGVGRQLAERLLGLALAKSPSSVSLNVFIDNNSAVNLYRSLGFRPVGPPTSEAGSMSQRMVLDVAKRTTDSIAGRK